jgi:hypothetical protein
MLRVENRSMRLGPAEYRILPEGLGEALTINGKFNITDRRFLALV